MCVRRIVCVGVSVSFTRRNKNRVSECVCVIYS